MITPTWNKEKKKTLSYSNWMKACPMLQMLFQLKWIDQQVKG